MANVVPVAGAFRPGRSFRVRTAVAQASTGQTDWLKVPVWASVARVTIDLTDVGASTTPILTPTLLTPSNAANAHLDDSVPPGTAKPPTDSVAINIGGSALTSGFTAAGTAVVSIGPGVTGIADDVALGTSGVTFAYLNDVLPDILGIKILNDRTTGDEVYTYTVEVLFR